MLKGWEWRFEKLGPARLKINLSIYERQIYKI
jgi:hypothetical protein